MNMGNPKRSSKFLCLNCMQINQLGTGIHWYTKSISYKRKVSYKRTNMF